MASVAADTSRRRASPATPLARRLSSHVDGTIHVLGLLPDDHVLALEHHEAVAGAPVVALVPDGGHQAPVDLVVLGVEDSDDRVELVGGFTEVV